ncbi:unnamed protein product [Brassica oleracea var. botrytis]|uniref:DDE Tnp4 domain-containing protein n=2 Tax=Brassica oleracea TaxID=3712 RepID=A0A0D3DA31_BRAOL|nr:unnamed protein product [Brassica oleracea]
MPSNEVTRAANEDRVWFNSERVSFNWERSSMTSSARTLNDINVLDRSPVFDDIYQGRAPRVTYMVNGHQYDLAYYLTDGIYPKWSTFIQSIKLPQGPKAELFAKVQKATRKDVERAFGVLQARFAIVKNPALSLDKEKIGKIIRACIILHNMIVKNERGGYTLYDTSEFEEGDSTRSSHVDHINNMPSHFGNMLGLRSQLRTPMVGNTIGVALSYNYRKQFKNPNTSVPTDQRI